MDTKDLFEVKLGLKPERFTCSELADIIVSIEESFVSLITHNDKKINKNDIIIGVSKIQKGSTIFNFFSASCIPKVQEKIDSAKTIILDSISKNNFNELPNSTIKSLNVLSKISKQHECNISFCNNAIAKQPIAQITPKTKIETSLANEIIGETTIYGKIITIGNKSPTVRIDINGQNNIISVKINEVQALELAPKLYKWVGFRGKATWDAITGSVKFFTLEEITSYEETPVIKAFDMLSENFGQYYNDIHDVNEYVAELRRE